MSERKEEGKIDGERQFQMGITKRERGSLASILLFFLLWNEGTIE